MKVTWCVRKVNSGNVCMCFLLSLNVVRRKAIRENKNNFNYTICITSIWCGLNSKFRILKSKKINKQKKRKNDKKNWMKDICQFLIWMFNFGTEREIQKNRTCFELNSKCHWFEPLDLNYARYWQQRKQS